MQDYLDTEFYKPLKFLEYMDKYTIFRPISRLHQKLGLFLVVISLAIIPAKQVSAAVSSCSVGATILGSIASSTMLNLEFGQMTAGPIAGAVILAPNGLRLSVGGVNLSLTGRSSPATFMLNGNPNATYAVTLPASVVISDGSGNVMVVDNFGSFPAGTGQLSATGQQSLSVGGKLNVQANQPMGNYNGVMTVQFVYN